MVVYALYGVLALVALAPVAIALGASAQANNVVYGASLVVTLTLCNVLFHPQFWISQTVAALVSTNGTSPPTCCPTQPGRGRT